MTNQVKDDITNLQNELSERWQQIWRQEAEVSKLRAALQHLVDANEGNLSDVDGALYEARKALKG